MNEKAIELAKKLKALAEKGAYGEKHNAQAVLNQLLSKHNLVIEQLEDDEESFYPFMVKSEQMQLFAVIVMNVLSTETRWIKGNNKKSTQILCTAAQAIELRAKFDFYWQAYLEDLDVFKRAFVMKHELWANGDFTNRELTEEEALKRAEEAHRARLMALTLKEKQYLKQLSEG